MKTILIVLFLTSLGLVAQTPPPPPPVSPAAIPAPPIAVTNSAAALKRLLAPAAARGITAPALPATGAPPAPARSTTAAPPALTAPPAPTMAVNPVSATPNAVAPAAATNKNDIPGITYDLVAADLTEVLKLYSDLVGRTIIRPYNLPTTPIVLQTQTPLTRREAKQALEAVLALNGVAVISVGEKFVKAVPVTDANMAGAAFNPTDAAHLPDLGTYVTHIVQLKYLKTSEAMAAIVPFAKIPNSIIPIETSQILVLRDYAENVKRMLEMIEKVDVSMPQEFVSEVIPIKFAKVADIAAALNSLSGSGGGTTVGGHTGGARSSGAGARPGQPYTPGTMTPGGMTPSSVGSPTGTPSSTASFSDRIRNIITKASSGTGAGDMQILGVTKIVADERSNSLLVFASRQDMAMIKDIVSKLDVVLAQVLIETIIMDVTLDNSYNFGVSASQQPKQFTQNVAAGGGINNGNPFYQFLQSATSNSFPGNFTSTLPAGGNYFGQIGNTWDLAVQAAMSDSRVNVIQTPRIQTSHATPASIFIGGTVPYVSSTYYGGGYAGGPSSSYQQLPVGIDLEVTPFINQDGLVVMQIQESIDELNGFTVITGVGNVPNTTSRRLSAEVAVRDRETILLGGFIRNADTKSKSGVPILSDIPLLGALFSSKSDTKDRQELIVMMRPTVLRTPELAAAQVDVEKARLPGIRAAEADLDREQKKNNARIPEKLYKPITPEGNPLDSNPTAPMHPATP